MPQNVYTSRFNSKMAGRGVKMPKRTFSRIGFKCYRFDIQYIDPGVLYYIYGKLHMDSMNSLTFASN